MSVIISEKAVKQAELNSARVKRGEDLQRGREELFLDKKLVRQLLEGPLVKIKKEFSTARIYITGLCLVPMNLDDVVDSLVFENKKTPYLHLELIEHSEAVSERTLMELGSSADSFLRQKLHQLKEKFEYLDATTWKGYRNTKVTKGKFKVFRSQVAVELKKEYGIKNL